MVRRDSNLGEKGGDRDQGHQGRASRAALRCDARVRGRAGGAGSGERSDGHRRRHVDRRAGTGMRSAPVTLTMQQNGAAVTGNLSVGGRPDLSGAVTGTLRGDLLRLSLPTTTLGELLVKQDTIAGVPVAGLPVTLQRTK